MEVRWRPARMRPIARIVAAGVLALASAWVPIDVAMACSCGFAGYPEAVAAADVAFVGTVVGEDEPAAGAGLETARYAFEVRRAKEPMTSPFEIDTIFGNGANCGLDMARGEEWLVLATMEGDRPTTNLCHGSAPTADMDPETRALLEEALPIDAGPDPVAESGGPPAPLLVATGAIVLVATVSALAFRREAR